MAEYTLQAQTREELGKRAQKVREDGLIPAVVYGGKENINIKIPKVPFEKLYDSAGESTIVNLIVDEKTTVPVLIYDTQRHPTTHDFSHVDFYEFDKTKEITATVPLNFIGVAPATKIDGGILLKNLEEVEISCLPKDLIHEITVDVSVLATYDDNIHVSDLQIPENIKIETSEDVMVARVAEPKEEEEVSEEVSEAEAVAAVAAAEEKKDEGEEKSAE